MSDFASAIKSTIDKFGVDLASSYMGTGVPFVDLDDTVNAENVLQSDVSAILWRLLQMDESPADPLWSLAFSIGAKTTSDPGNYELMALIDAIRKNLGVPAQAVPVPARPVEEAPPPEPKPMPAPDGAKSVPLAAPPVRMSETPGTH